MRRVAIVLAALGGLAGAGVAALLLLGGGPMYTPGRLHARPDLEPPRGATDPAFFQVTPDVRLFHVDEGRGPAVIVVHGGPGLPPAQPWPLSARLAAEHRFVYYHQRGCGRSTRPFTRLPGRSTWDRMQALHARLGLPEQIADLERLRRLLGEERVVLVGHSFGALLAALYAAEFPDRVAALVALAPPDLAVMPSPRGDLYAWVAERLAPPLAAEFGAYRARAFDFGALLGQSDAELAAFHARFARYYAAAAGVAPPAGEAPGGLMPLALYLGLGRRHDWRAALAGVRAPVLVVHGGRDLQPEAASRAFAAGFARHEVAVIPAAGHFVATDAPEELAGIVRRFLAAP
jgi:proline iminopeptidase